MKMLGNDTDITAVH